MSEYPPCGQCQKEMTVHEALAFNYIYTSTEQLRVCYLCHLKEQEKNRKPFDPESLIRCHGCYEGVKFKEYDSKKRRCFKCIEKEADQMVKPNDSLAEKIEMNCPYCDKPARWCENKEIYGRNYGKSYMCYSCKACDAYVGCHQNSRKPLGTMANKELRAMRQKTHAVLDPFWKNGEMKRGQIYAILREKLGRVIHVGESSVDECQEIINICLKMKEEK